MKVSASNELVLITKDLSSVIDDNLSVRLRLSVLLNFAVKIDPRKAFDVSYEIGATYPLRLQQWGQLPLSSTVQPEEDGLVWWPSAGG